MTQSKILHPKNGFALIYAILVMFLITITITAMVSFFAIDYQQSKKTYSVASAYQMAQSAIEDGITRYQKSPTNFQCSETTGLQYVTTGTAKYFVRICATDPPFITGTGIDGAVGAANTSIVTLRANINKATGNVEGIYQDPAPPPPCPLTVKSLLHFDTANFFDQCLTGWTSNIGGGLSVDSTPGYFKWVASLRNDSLASPNPAYLRSNASPDFNPGSGDFTIDFWYQRNDSPTEKIFDKYQDANNYYYLQAARGGGVPPDTFFTFKAVVGGVVVANYTMSPSMPTFGGTMRHVALVRSGSTMYLFVNGDSQNFVGSPSLNASTTINNTGEQRIFELVSPSTSSMSHIDEFRFQKGIAQWKTNFTPPIAPWPNP